MSKRFNLAKEKFIIKLNEALEACYEAHMENNGAVLTLNIKDLYIELQKQKKEENENHTRHTS